MENLMNALDQFEMKFNEGQKICFSEFVGEEHEGKTFGAMLNLSGLSDHTNQIADWNISRECQWLFDDGWFHLKINRDLLSQDFINEIDFD